ncbi:MAG: hypothetical protein ACK5L5_04775 [Bacteroidales bacterium]
MRICSKISSFVLMSLFLLLETGVPIYKSICCKHKIDTSLYFANNDCNGKEKISTCCDEHSLLINDNTCCKHKDIDCCHPNNESKHNTDNTCGDTKRHLEKLSIDIYSVVNIINIDDIAPIAFIIPQWNLPEFTCFDDIIEKKHIPDEKSNLPPHSYGRELRIFLNQLSISPRPC